MPVVVRTLRRAAARATGIALLALAGCGGGDPPVGSGSASGGGAGGATAGSSTPTPPVADAGASWTGGRGGGGQAGGAGSGPLPDGSPVTTANPPVPGPDGRAPSLRDGGDAAGGGPSAPPPASPPIPPTPSGPLGVGPASVADLPAGDPAGDKTYTEGGFAMWVPGGIKRLRCNWFTGESRREIARLLNCNQISVGSGRDTMAPETLAALVALARASGHPEIAHLPIVASGYSAAARFPRRLVAATPDRMIGIFTGGIGGMGPDMPAERLVPWMHFEGERDGKRDMGATHLMTAIEDRAGTALFAKAIRWGEGHEWGDVNNLFFAWAFQIIHRRAPAPAALEPTPAAPVAPAPIAEKDGWLVDMEGWGTSFPDVAPHGSYTKDKARAGWVADSYTAHVWRAYSAYRSTTPVKIANPAPQCPGCSPFVRKVGTALSVELTVGADATGVELWDGDRKLGDVTGPPFKKDGIMLDPGVHALIGIATAGGMRHASKPSVVIITKVAAPPTPPPM